MFFTVAQVKAANQKNGYVWFSRGTMRHFGTRIVGGYSRRLIHARFFLTSDISDFGAGRVYTIRVALDNGAVRTAVTRKFATWQEALAVAKRLNTEPSPCANCRTETYNPNYTCDKCAGEQ